MDNADIIFRKLHDNQIDDIPIEDGNVIFNKDTKQILVDDDDNGVEKRYRFGGSEKLINVILLSGTNTKTIYDDSFSTNNLNLIRVYTNENFTYNDLNVYDGYCVITYVTLDHDVNIQIGIGGVSEFHRLIVEGQASDISYNHSISGLQATNTQEAIDEVVSNQKTTDDKLTASDDLVFDFTKSGSEYGYKDANGNFVPFKTTHTDTYTYPSGSTGGTYDMGVKHQYRYVNATNVYNKGKADGESGKITPNYAYVTSKNYTVDASSYGQMTFSATSGAIYAVSYSGSDSADSSSITVSGGTLLGVKKVEYSDLHYSSFLAIVKATSTSVTVYPNGSEPYGGIGIVVKVGA